jgi:hypothetical protein
MVWDSMPKWSPPADVPMTTPLRSPFLFAWQAAERARRALKETLVPSGRRGKKVIPVRPDLLVRQDRPDLRDRKALGRRLALGGHL